MLYDELYALSAKKAVKKLWVFSDLQPAGWRDAQRCMDIAVRDYQTLTDPADFMLNLGDTISGDNLEELEKMTEVQRTALESLGIPLIYVSGNHEYDYAGSQHREGIEQPYMPFYEMVKRHPDWYCAAEMDQSYFKVELNEDYVLYCFTDHIDKKNQWCSTHNGVRWGWEIYPYTDEYFVNIRKEMEQDKHKYIITAAHEAFPGGNRETYLLSKIQPLPVNVKIHLYGHAHLGDYVYPKERVFSCINWIDWQDIPQVDVAPLEDHRGSCIRSAFIHLYDDGSMGLFFRNHSAGNFLQAFFTKGKSFETPGDYEKYAHRK